jgi:hypothetical protein
MRRHDCHASARRSDPPSTRAPIYVRGSCHLALRVARAELDRHSHEGIDADDIAQEVLLRLATLDLSEVATGGRG